MPSCIPLPATAISPCWRCSIRTSRMRTMRLARRGRCSAVVTTNFDTLLERAFRRFRTSARVMRKRGCGDESETRAFMRMGTASPNGVLLGVGDLR